MSRYIQQNNTGKRELPIETNDQNEDDFDGN